MTLSPALPRHCTYCPALSVTTAWARLQSAMQWILCRTVRIPPEPLRPCSVRHCLSCSTRGEMPSEKISEVIALRIRNPLSTRKRNKSTNTPDDRSLAAGVRANSPSIPPSNLSEESSTPDQRVPTTVSSSKTSNMASWARHASDTIQTFGPVARAAAGTIPIAGSPLKNAIDGLLAILQIIDARIQNKEDLDRLSNRLRVLSCHVANAPTARTRFEETSRRALIKVLDETTSKLREMESRRLHGSPLLTQQIAGCYSGVNEHLVEFTTTSLRLCRAMWWMINLSGNLLWRCRWDSYQ